MVRRRRWLQDRGGVRWWMARLVERYELPGVVVFWGSGEIPVFDTDAVTLVSVADPS